MKILMSYAVTHSVLPRFLKTHWFQTTYFQEAVQGIDRVVICDREEPEITWQGIRGVHADVRVNGVFNLSKAKNVAFDLARDEGYDWLLDADADRVLTLLSLPPDPLSHIPLYWAQKEDRYEDLAAKARASQLHLMSGSFFALRRDVFTRVRFCEEFLITRWDDVDFIFNVCPASGFHLKHHAGKGIHLWHSNEERCYHVEDRNSTLYRERQKLFSGKKP